MAASTLVVDADGSATLATCSPATTSPTYSTIQSAVDAAVAGDTIKVCPGTYNESVTVNKQLKLVGPYVGTRASACPNRANSADVSGTSTYAFDLQADGITLDGFRMHNTSYGVHTSSVYSGYLIYDNVIENNSGGIYLNASGAKVSKVKWNCIRDNNLTFGDVTPFPTAGTGIYTDQGLKNAVINGNGFRRQLNVAINLAETISPPTDTSNIRIRNNTSVNDTTFLSTYGASKIVVQLNAISQTSAGQDWNGSAIYIGGGTTDTGGPGSQSVTIDDNRITSTQLPNGFYAAIAVRSSANGVIVENNFIRGTYNGISVTTDSVGGALVRGNIIQNVHNNGIEALAGTAQNVFNGNHVSGSATYDCNDVTTGTERKGVANTWHGPGPARNVGPVSNPSGLCFPS